MEPLLLVLYAMSIAIAAVGVWRAKQLWRDETDELDQFSVASRQTFIVRVIGVIALVACAPPVLLAGGPDDWPAYRIAATIIVTVAMIGTVLLYLSIRVSGRPQGLIPPHLRGRGRASS